MSLYNFLVIRIHPSQVDWQKASDRQQVRVIAEHLLFAELGGLRTCVQQVASVQTLLEVDEFIVFLIL
jgi:hypothetical protein